jgi:serine/threonine protein kinase/tetratricopeptide (TPR) repeat protein
MLGSTLLDRYRIEAELGKGGMGTVYRGYDLLLNRYVALKVLNAAYLSQTGKARLLTEARAAAKLNHFNIVTIYDVAEAEGIPFIVMELVPGEPPRLEPELNLEATIGLISQVCAALEHAHTSGIIHRDLKLENILLTSEHVVKLMDFGLARLNEGPRLTEAGTVMGTILYMAPELLMGEEASVQSDLYALGVMFYELASGHPPFKGGDHLALISQHLHATPVPPSTYNPAIPAGVETLILKLLAKQPEDRPASAAEVRASLAAESGSVEKSEVSKVTALDRIVRGRLVGRERELKEALQLWHKVQQGDSEILLISGEPGIGKSRLAREVMVQVRIEHGNSLVGECYAEGNVPYSAFAQMILNTEDWPSDLPPLVLADLISLAPELRVRYPDVPANPSLDPQAEQQRLYESAFIFFSRLANKAPLLLVLEDVHWADGGTLALARSLARRFHQTKSRVLMVLTFREMELTEQKGLSDLLNNWNREHLATSLKLHRLDAQGTQNLLEALFAEAVTADFADRVYRDTEGNPFFIEEICKALIDGGQVYREDGRWQRRSTSSLEMPRSIRMAIETRLSGLPEASQEVLHVAAVLGRRFEFDVLQAASDSTDAQTEENLITALEAAEHAQLLFEVGREGGGTFEFAHALIPTTLMEGISGMRRRRLHRRAIAALEKLHPEDDKTLAHHCLGAGEDERAVDFLLKAADKARGAFANTEAVSNYQQALGLLDELRRESSKTDHWLALTLRLNENLGDVLELTGQHEEAWTAYQNALTAVAAGTPIQASRLYRKAGKTRETLRLYDEAAQAYQKADMALGEPASDASSELWQEWINIQMDRIYLGYWRGQVAEMEQLINKVLPIMETHSTPQQRAMFYWNRTAMNLRRWRYVVSEEMLSDIRLGHMAAQEGGIAGQICLTTFLFGFVLLWHHDLDEAEKQLLSALQLAEKTGDVTVMSRSLTYLTVIHRQRGNIEKVRHYAARSQETAAVGQMIEYVGMAQANLAWAERRDGRIMEARELGESAWATMQKTPQVQMFPWVAGWPLLAINLVEGRGADAIEYARGLLNPTAHPQPEEIAIPLQAAIEAWEQGRGEDANMHLTKAAELAEPLGYL